MSIPGRPILSELEIKELHSRALQEGLGLTRMKVKEDNYFFSDKEKLQRVIGIVIN
jgi:hypothetical protein